LRELHTEFGQAAAHAQLALGAFLRGFGPLVLLKIGQRQIGQGWDGVHGLRPCALNGTGTRFRRLCNGFFRVNRLGGGFCLRVKNFWFFFSKIGAFFLFFFEKKNQKTFGYLYRASSAKSVTVALLDELA